mmetsp:Transcript_10863/g.11282  ORF Transcript_10863/g.11282 Transcript_10863/m.11282 type:complete len:176 (+) Transcript_10863:63-590(+)
MESTSTSNSSDNNNNNITYDWNDLYLDKEREFDQNIYLSSLVVHGFKRGSKELGIPTANLDMEQLGEIGTSLETGIYYGWAKLNENYYETVVSVGWNPFYNNTVKTIEAHLLHSLSDFYGEKLELLLCGYLRQEANFKSLDELISCIHCDIAKAKGHLEKTTELCRNQSNWSPNN